MKKILGATIFSSLLFCGLATTSSAEEEMLVSKENQTSIDLDWKEGKGSYYEVYRDDKLIYNGKNSEFQDTNLNSNTMYSYDIVLYKKNKKEIEDIIKYKTQTKKRFSKSLIQSTSQKNKSYENEDAVINAAVTKDYIKLDWANLSDDDGVFEIYRDDKKIDMVKTNSYTDENIINGESYRYKIIAEQTVSDERKETIQSKLIEEGYKKEDIPESAYRERKTVIKDVMTLKNLDKKEILKKDLTPQLEDFQSAASTLDSFIIRYTTFIPMKYVANNNWLAGDSGTYLKGDGYGNDKANWRGFDFFNSSYRTRVDVMPEWYNGSPGFYSEKDVSQSTLYENASAIGKSCSSSDVRCATASDSGITITKEYSNTSYIEWRVEHSASVPFGISYPGIDYRYDARMYKNGNITASGNHDRAPNHEVYLARAYSSLPAYRIHDFSVGGEGDFYNLFPPVPNEYWQYSS